MKSLLTLPVILLAATSAHAGDGAFEFGLAGGATITDPLEVLGTAPTLNPRIGYWVNPTLAIEADIGIMPGQTQIGTPDFFPAMSIIPRVNLVGRIWPEESMSILFVAGFGAWSKKISDDGELALPQGTDSDLDFVVNGGPGFMFPISDSFAIRTDLRWMLSLGNENWENHGDAFMNWETTVGALITLGGPKDSDDDGIVDDIDQCIDDAEDMDAFQDEDGCPDLDNDEDGVADVSDTCPDEAEDADGFADDDGCPELDNDEDGVLDADDICPLDSGMASAAGCPDMDEDGLKDSIDECVEDAGPESAFGCPDSDADRVPDHRDACPEEAAPKDVNPMRSNGCMGAVYYSAKALVITDTIEFASGRATIRRSSDTLIEAIAGALTNQKTVKLIQIGGHTDSQGDPAKNLKLSEDRAIAVHDRLVELGVAEGRLQAKGFGDTVSIADNETDEGREKNRRVEFLILEQDDSGRFQKKRKGTKDVVKPGTTEEVETKTVEKAAPEAAKTVEKPAPEEAKKEE